MLNEMISRLNREIRDFKWDMLTEEEKELIRHENKLNIEARKLNIEARKRGER
jgi:hypothetical protein